MAVTGIYGTYPHRFSSVPTLRGRHEYPYSGDGETEAQEVPGSKVTWL